MKICKNEKEFIQYVAPFAQKVCKRYGFLPSILIAQTFHENGAAVPSNFDNSGIYDLMKYNNMVGQKAKLLNDTWSDYSVWPGVKPGKFEEYSFYKETPEEYGGRMTTITDAFRKFDSVEQSLADYILFLLYAKDSVNAKSYRYGPDVVNIQDPYKLIKAVGKKYATGSSYAENVYDVVKRYNLTKYDDLTNVKPTNIVPDILKKSTSKTSTTKKADNAETINIIKTYITTNNSNSTNDPIAIVIHNTDNFARTATAYAHAEGLYHGYMQGMSWHYAVDDKEIYQCLPHNRGAWHVGRNFGSNNLFGIINNRNSIGIEMCVNAGYDYEKAFQNTVKLTKYLMKELNIPASKVYQHYDICTKDCPSQIRKRGDWPRFKKLIGDNSYVVNASSSSSSSTKSYLSKGDSGDDVKKLQTMLNACGYNCGTIDGDFGSKTEKAVKIMQLDLLGKGEDDGKYGPKSKAALEKAYKAINTTQTISLGAKTFLNAVKAVADQARTQGWVYGNSTTTPPCADKKISCDRLIARAMYNLGYTDQPKGGFVCGNVIDAHLLKWGFIKVTEKNKIKPGAIVAVKKKTQKYMNHVFVVKTYDLKTDRCDKYDMGNNERIKTIQPFKNVKLIEWADRDFVCAWNVPDSLTDKTKKSTIPTTSNTIFQGVDYSPVYNYSYYKNKYSDLKKAFGNNKEKYFEHFCKFGMKEQRQASSTFNVKKYKNRYEDLRKAFGNNIKQYYKHYCLFGKKEKRKAT